MKLLLVAVCAALLCQSASAGFVENFNSDKLATDSTFENGWGTLTGSGEATVSFTQKNHHGFMTVDGRKDRRNIYWALIKRGVTRDIDMAKLLTPGHALRLEVKLRLSDAPRRVHFQINTNRTTDYDANLREFDLPDTGWHVISWTHTDLDVKPGDHVFVTLGMTDMGRAVYTSEIAYVKAEVVDAAEAVHDQGPPLVYRPPLKPLGSYKSVVPVAEDAVLDSAYPWANFKSWSNMTDGDGSQGCEVIAISGSMTSILRFDLSAFKGRTADGWGVLALTTDSVQWGPSNLEEFGYLRAVEIKAGQRGWTRDAVTRDSFFQGKPDLEVLNGQLMTDVPPAIHRGETTYIRINPAVLQRLIDGSTQGLAIYAQGEIYASFASSQSPNPGYRPTLYFNVK
jgi:hypothetical protein